MATPSKPRITFGRFDALVPLSELKGSRHQRNIHPPEQIERLAKIMREQGVRHPIHVSNLSGEVCFGHGRWAAAKLNGWSGFPVVYQDFENAQEEYACVQSDNAIAHWAELDLVQINEDLLSMPDFDIDLLGIKDLSLIEPEVVPQCDEDEVPEHVEPRAKLGDVYQLGRHRVMCGDAVNADQFSALVDGAKIDLVVTDPPYGINAIKSSGVLSARYEQYANEESDQCALDFLNFAIGHDLKIMAFGGNYFAHALPKSTHWLIWDKRGAEMEGGSANGDQSDCEIAWTNLDKKNVKIYKHVWAGWFRSGNKKDELATKVHPSQKPVGLFEKIFEDYPFTTCLDGFGGSGSILIAAEKTKRTCYMMELDPHYVDVIVARWEKYTGQKAELVNGQTES